MNKLFFCIALFALLSGCTQKSDDRGTEVETKSDHALSAYKESIDRGKAISKEVDAHDAAARELNQELQDE